MKNLINKIKSFNLSPNVLADKSGINLERILLILENQIDPSLSEIRKIAKALRISPDFLISENKEIPALSVLFRKSFTDYDRPKVNKLSYLLSNTIPLLGEYDLKNEILDQFPNVLNTYEGAKQLAEKFRELFFNFDFVTPILNLPSIVADKLNCILLVFDLGNGTDGASIIYNNIPFIVICPRFEPRMLFTLAHELGHILSHHREQSYALIDDSDNNIKKKNNDEEAFAHAFASELLMPQEGIGITLKTIRRVLKIEGEFIGEVELLYLSRIYGVSFETAALRCENLGLIPIGSSISFYEALVKEYKNPENRARQLGLPDRDKIIFPKVSANLIIPTINKIKSGEISLEKASELLSISAVEIVNYNSLN